MNTIVRNRNGLETISIEASLRSKRILFITDEITDEQRKEVEDTCRAMISSWETDAEQYRRYKNSDTAEYKELAEQSRINANITATSYNDYILLNGYVFGDTLPDGVYAVIEIIE